AEADYQHNLLQGRNIDPVTGEVSPVDVGRLAGNVATPLPVKAPAAVTGPGKTLLGSVGKGLVHGALTGAETGVLQPVLEPGIPGTPGDTFAQQKLQKGATGAVVGTVTGGGTGTGGAVTNKAVNGARNLSPRYAQVERALEAATASDG